MNQDELIKLLSAHEWNDVEFKEAQQAVPKNAYETVSAFANTAGGHLVFGVRKDGTRFEVVGVLDVDKVQNEFVSTLRQQEKISLIINVEEHLHNINGNDLLIFYVPEATRADKPVFLNKDIRKAFIRKGGADVRCSQEEIQRLINDASADRYDGHTIEFDLQSCFDTASISWYRNVYERKPGNRSYADRNDIEFLFELGLIRETPQGWKASRAAILLFGRDGSFRDIMPRPVADCQRFGTAFGEYTPGARWDDRIVLDFNLIRAWQSLLDWYQRVATTPFRVDPATMQRTDMPPDYIAFREAVINVLIHQDYSDHSRKPEIRHFPDRTIFWNPGDAFASLVDLLEPGEKEVRNPRIVTAFRRIGLSENAGWGLRDVFTNWQQLGNVPPVIHNDKAAKTFELVLPKELLLSEEQIMFQAQLGVHLDPDAARLFAYICRKKEISVADAKAVLAQSTERSLAKLDYLVNQALVQAVEPQKFYGLAEHLLSRFPSDQASDQVDGRLVTQVTDQPQGAMEEPVQPKLELSEHQRQVLRLCEFPRSTGNLMSELGLSHRAFFRTTILQPLLTGGLLQQTYPGQPNHPKQAYVLTEAGLRLLELMKTQGTTQRNE
ncbi:MAG: putative DNA binding domain-containing protein [Desulfobulbus sp.]|jgi:ATP-dependent DNA helicase RecG|uniref:RNA-binding domain-containing protein n=1 Tax=Desulfobulbus sp. TaxID=895 RepID=UPI00284B3E92|nr:RNA-binding domain-containing protein [Desulfobulbus sp.]MDR2548957.1 putative DNA binding domain-containing protein [Desulfobulbus sp.]